MNPSTTTSPTMNDIDPKQYNVACKYFMNGYCKNGIECSYYHPQPNEFMIYYNILLREQLISNPPMIPYCCQVIPQPNPAYFVNHQQLPSPNSFHNTHHQHNNIHHTHHHHQQKYVPPNISMYSEVFEDGDEEVSFYQPKVCTFYLSGKGCKYGYHCKFFHPTIQSTNRVNQEKNDHVKSPSTSTSPANSISEIPISKIQKSHQKGAKNSRSPTHSSRSSSSDSASNSSMDDKRDEFFQQTYPEMVQENASYASVLRKSIAVLSQ